MSGGHNCTSVPRISVGGNAITSKIDIVNTHGVHFTSVFNSNNYDPSFKLLKETTETLPLNFFSRFTEPYKAVLHVDELLVTGGCRKLYHKELHHFTSSPLWRSNKGELNM
jgi:hypothetical protein